MRTPLLHRPVVRVLLMSCLVCALPRTGVAQNGPPPTFAPNPARANGYVSWFRGDAFLGLPEQYTAVSQGRFWIRMPYTCVAANSGPVYLRYPYAIAQSHFSSAAYQYNLVTSVPASWNLWPNPVSWVCGTKTSSNYFTMNDGDTVTAEMGIAAVPGTEATLDLTVALSSPYTQGYGSFVIALGTDVTAPQLSLTAGSSTTSSVSFTASASDSRSGVYGFKVLVDGTQRTGDAGYDALFASSGSRSFTFGGLQAGREYVITVSAFDNLANESASQVLRLTTQSGGGGGGIPSSVQSLLDSSPFVAKLVFPTSTSWSPSTIRANAAYADGTLDGGYLLLSRQFSDFQAVADPVLDTPVIPGGIGLTYVVGPNRTIYVAATGSLPNALMPLFGLPSTVGGPLSFPNLPLSADDMRSLRLAGMGDQDAISPRFLTLAQIGMLLYRDWVGRGLVTNPLSVRDTVRLPAISLVNNTGRRVAIGYGRIATDCLKAGDDPDPFIDRWWPKGAADACGTAAGGFGLSLLNTGSHWFTWSGAYSDNTATARVLWNGTARTSVVDYGGDTLVTTSPTALPATVAMEHSDVWSGNSAHFAVVTQADELRFSGVWESPQVGAVVQPVSFYVEPGWQHATASLPAGDYDGDGLSDYGVFRPTQRAWYIKRSRDGNLGLGWGAPGDIPVPADYDGDGRTDIAVFRPDDGGWYIVRSTGGSLGRQWGEAGDIPVPADYDGDGRADLAVWRPSSGTWFVVRSAGGSVGVPWGTAGDVPVPADYDGDGRADLAVFRPGDNGWYIVQSSAGAKGLRWGTTGDIPVVADYDGDHRADVGVFRPSESGWYIVGSAGAAIGKRWGTSGDLPVFGDMDGDHRADVTVFRPSQGGWYVIRSSGGSTGATWGTVGDRPI